MDGANVCDTDGAGQPQCMVLSALLLVPLIQGLNGSSVFIPYYPFACWLKPAANGNVEQHFLFAVVFGFCDLVVRLSVVQKVRTFDSSLHSLDLMLYLQLAKC